MPKVRVVATATGWDSAECVMREKGDVFEVDAKFLEPMPKRDDKGQPIPGQFYDPPWFVPAEQAEARARAAVKQGARGRAVSQEQARAEAQEAFGPGRKDESEFS